jgi:hypothetical protein
VIPIRRNVQGLGDVRWVETFTTLRSKPRSHDRQLSDDGHRTASLCCLRQRPPIALSRFLTYKVDNVSSCLMQLT